VTRIVWAIDRRFLGSVSSERAELSLRYVSSMRTAYARREPALCAALGFHAGYTGYESDGTGKRLKELTSRPIGRKLARSR
jgi:hypothetical protein